MPTYGWFARFGADFDLLSPEQQTAFLLAVEQFVEDLDRGAFRKGLRVKGLKGATGVFEMTWADDGRATFEYDTPIREGESHILWRRIGTHAIFAKP
jgi:hypothetical protein